MKTYLTYGFVMALAGTLVTLGLFFFGYHTDPTKVQMGQWISMPIFIAITVGCMVLGIKARQADIPLTEDFGYGRALGTGVMIVLFAAIFGTIFNAIYFSFINPDFVDVMVQAQSAKMEEKGLSATQIEQMEKGMRFMMKPALLAVFGFIQSMVWGTVIALITAAFLRRAAVPEPVTAA